MEPDFEIIKPAIVIQIPTQLSCYCFEYVYYPTILVQEPWMRGMSFIFITTLLKLLNLKYKF
jgi:hypothetical protein